MTCNYIINHMEKQAKDYELEKEVKSLEEKEKHLKDNIEFLRGRRSQYVETISKKLDFGFVSLNTYEDEINKLKDQEIFYRNKAMDDSQKYNIAIAKYKNMEQNDPTKYARYIIVGEKTPLQKMEEAFNENSKEYRGAINQIERDIRKLQDSKTNLQKELLNIKSTSNSDIKIKGEQIAQKEKELSEVEFSLDSLSLSPRVPSSVESVKSERENKQRASERKNTMNKVFEKEEGIYSSSIRSGKKLTTSEDNSLSGIPLSSSLERATINPSDLDLTPGERKKYLNEPRFESISTSEKVKGKQPKGEIKQKIRGRPNEIEISDLDITKEEKKMLRAQTGEIQEEFFEPGEMFISEEQIAKRVNENKGDAWYKRLVDLFPKGSSVVKAVRNLDFETKLGLGAVILAVGTLGAYQIYNYIFPPKGKAIEMLAIGPADPSGPALEILPNRPAHPPPDPNLYPQVHVVEEMMPKDLNPDLNPRQPVFYPEQGADRTKYKKKEYPLRPDEIRSAYPYISSTNIQIPGVHPQVVRAEVDKLERIFKKAELRKIELKDDTAYLQKSVFNRLNDKINSREYYDYEGSVNKYFKPSLFRGYS